MTRTLLALLLCTALLPAACGGGGDETDAGDAGADADALEAAEELPPCEAFPAVETGGDGADVSQPLAAGKAVAGKIARAEDVPTGVKSPVQVGDIMLRNAHVVFVIENTGGGTGFRSDGYNPFGGEIVFADRWVGDGPSGANLMGELFYGLGIQLIDPATVTVMKDGSDGGDAVVRVTGELRAMPLFDEGLGSLLDPRPFGGQMYIDYSLGPDDEHLQVTYHVRNTYNKLMRINMPIYGGIMGDGLKAMTPESGFDNSGFKDSHDLYGYVGRAIGYGALDGKGGQLRFILEESQIIAASLSESIELPACAEVEVPALKIAVAPGGAEALLAVARKVRGESEPARLTGTVTTDGTTPVAKARVHVATAGGTFVTSALTAADGTYAAGLAPGAYKVTVVGDGRDPVGPHDVTMAAGDQVYDVTLPGAGTFRYTVKDGEAAPIPAKLIITRKSGPAAPPAMFGEDAHPGGAYLYVFETDGDGEVTLPAGAYDVSASRGFWYEKEKQDVTVAAGAAAEADFVLAKSVDTTGYWCGDFHQHSFYSPDSWPMPAQVVAANVAEGLDIIVSTDHDWIQDWQPDIEALGLDDIAVGIPGDEITTYVYGHFNAFPLAADPSAWNRGSIVHYYKSPAEMFAEALANPLHPVLQINHPRSTGIGGYFSAVGLDPVTCQSTKPEWWSDLWNAIEVFNGSDFRENESTADDKKSVGDWFGLLNCGYRFTTTGNSDGHDLVRGTRGYPRNCLEMSETSPGDITYESFLAAFKALKVVVSGGAFITVDIGGAGMGETAQLAGGSGELNVKVQAAEWVGIDRMRVFVSGTEVATVTLDETTRDPVNPVIRYDDAVTIGTGGEDGWVIVEVEGDGSLAPVVNGQRPFAVTNPIFIDAI